MQVVLLAAGTGSRLGALTERLPKALIEVGGEPLLCHAVRFARLVEPAEIVVVGGFGFADVAAEVARRGLAVTLVENSSFRDGNLLSLMAARPRLGGGAFLVMNVDHVYRPAVAARVAAPVEEITAFVDRDRQLGPDDMKVACDDSGRVREIAKTLTRYDCGYVGMTRVPDVGGATARYWAAADAVLAAEGRAVHVERVLARMATSLEPPACRDISGIGWLEVDLPEERAHADSAVRGDPGGWC
jgi:choline kinase